MVEPRAAWRVACVISASGVTRETVGSKQQLCSFSPRFFTFAPGAPVVGPYLPCVIEGPKKEAELSRVLVWEAKSERRYLLLASANDHSVRLVHGQASNPPPKLAR